MENRTDTRYEWTALSVTTVGALLASIQGSALTIALPQILTGLRAGFLTIMWVLLGYLLITTALVPVIGRLADMYGRKNLYNAGFVIFTLGSLLAGLSQPQFHAWDMVVSRVIQGVGGALLFTNSTAIVTDAFERGRVGLGLGVNQIAAAAGFLLGPVVGGLLTAISWRWVYLVNVPLGIFGTVWGILRLREPRRPAPSQTFDWPGSVTFTVGLGATLLALSLLAFPLLAFPIVMVILGCGVVGLIFFFVVEVRAPQPMLDLRLFRQRLFSFASLANALNGLARGAVLFVLIFFLQGPYGKDPLQAGIMMAPFGAAFMLVGPFSGYLSDRHGSRGLATAGLLVSAVGLFGLATVSASTPYWLLALYMVLMGGGSGLFSSPNTNTIMTAVAREHRGSAAGIRTMLMNTGQMLSITLAFPLVLSRIPQDVMFKIFLYGGGMSGASPALESFTRGLHEVFGISVVITIVAALVSALQPSHQAGCARRRAGESLTGAAGFGTSIGMATPTDEQIARLPKAEVHLHLEGTIAPETLWAMAAANHVALPADSIHELRRLYAFTSFDAFIELWLLMCSCFRTPEDYERMVDGFLSDCARQNIRYAELHFTPYNHEKFGIGGRRALDIVTRRFAAAQSSGGPIVRLITDISGESAGVSGDYTVTLLEQEANPLVVALGLGGPETGLPRAMFREFFDRARRAGYWTVAHAGETGGAAHVQQAVMELGVRRVQHGVRAAEDPAVLRLLAERGVCCDIALTSNECLKVFPSVAAHPLRRFMDAGVPVTLSTDDPPFFGTDLGREWRRARDELGLSATELWDLNLNGLRYGLAETGIRRLLMQQFEQAAKLILSA